MLQFSIWIDSGRKIEELEASLKKSEQEAKIHEMQMEQLSKSFIILQEKLEKETDDRKQVENGRKKEETERKKLAKKLSKKEAEVIRYESSC